MQTKTQSPNHHLEVQPPPEFGSPELASNADVPVGFVTGLFAIKHKLTAAREILH
jgi:hypothetical protein